MSTGLTSLAILKVNFDNYGKDLLDDFLPFVADQLYQLDQAVVALPELQEAIRESYGLLIPTGVLKTITKRCAKKGMLKRDAGVLKPNRSELATHNLTATRGEVRRQHEALLAKGVQYATQHFNATLTNDEFDLALSDFIKENAAPLLKTIVEGHPLLHSDGTSPSNMRYLIASFVSTAVKEEPDTFTYLVSIVKGSILASALYFQDLTAMNRRLEKLAVYLDTTILLRAIGACGPELELIAREAIALATGHGATVRYFAHTLVEMEGVLDACERAVKRQTGQYHGEATEFMISAGWQASDVILLRSTIQEKLAVLGVHVSERPDHIQSLTLDEVQLERELQTHVHYQSRSARLKDLDSLTSIYRLRRGQEATHLERARAVFVTQNTALVRAAKSYARLEDFNRYMVPLAMPDYEFVTLLWLKQPLTAPELPGRRIIADCYAAMSPEDKVWSQYVEKIERLRADETVSEDQYILLRQSLSARSLMLFTTHEDPAEFTEGTVRTVLEKAEQNIARATRSDLEDERRRLEEISAEFTAQRARLDLVAHKTARKAIQILSFVVGATAIVGTIISAPWPWSNSLGAKWPITIIFICLIVTSGLSIYGMLSGGSIASLTQAAEARLTNHIRRWLTHSEGKIYGASD
ncbi:hypothetical protein [Actinopolymorpha pittospori]|uniref:Uncharacterized protein n=1 Tax=Actinopolymorpha pittospori TaxID=648752 RepID=A0A927MT42_9ACTN|nr:hypothetical protein [Actinopolymorpha pittospori]MBE1606425.1 hypothetical protein [Actinopolymorpha pittospori]